MVRFFLMGLDNITSYDKYKSMMKDGEMKVTLDLRHEACGSCRAMMTFIKKVETTLGYKLASQKTFSNSHELIFRKVDK